MQSSFWRILYIGTVRQKCVMNDRRTCRIEKKFHADLLQRSYQQIADQFGITKRDATNAVVELEK